MLEGKSDFERLCADNGRKNSLTSLSAMQSSLCLLPLNGKSCGVNRSSPAVLNRGCVGASMGEL